MNKEVFSIMVRFSMVSVFELTVILSVQKATQKAEIRLHDGSQIIGRKGRKRIQEAIVKTDSRHVYEWRRRHEWIGVQYSIVNAKERMDVVYQLGTCDARSIN